MKELDDAKLLERIGLMGRGFLLGGVKLARTLLRRALGSPWKSFDKLNLGIGSLLLTGVRQNKDKPAKE